MVRVYLFLLGIALFTVSVVHATDDEVESLCPGLSGAPEQYLKAVRSDLRLIKHSTLKTKVIEVLNTIFPNDEQGFAAWFLNDMSTAVWGLGDGNRIFDGAILKLVDILLNNKEKLLKLKPFERYSKACKLVCLTEFAKEVSDNADISVANWLNPPKDWKKAHWISMIKAVDYMNGLNAETLVALIQTTNKLSVAVAVYPFGDRLKFVLQCAEFNKSLVKKGYETHNTFILQLLCEFLKGGFTIYNEFSAFFFDKYLPSQYEKVQPSHKWWAEHPAFDLSQFKGGDGCFPWDNAAAELMGVLRKARVAKDYPGLAPPEGMSSRQVVEVHRVFTNSLQCLDVLDKPYLCDLKVFADLAKLIFRRLVIENAAEYIPEDEILDFKKEIESMEAMSFLRFAILMDRIEILLTHPERRNAQTFLLNIPYGYYGRWLSSQGKKYMNHGKYTELVATSGNRFTREFVSTTAQVQFFPDIVIFPYLFYISRGELLGCLTLPKGTVLPDYLKDYKIPTDNFRPIAMINRPIDHDNSFMATPDEFRRHDGQHEVVKRIFTGTVARSIKLSSNESYESIILKDTLQEMKEKIPRQHNLYHSMVASMNILVRGAPDLKTKLCREFFAFDLLHERLLTFTERINLLYDESEFCKILEQDKFIAYIKRFVDPKEFDDDWDEDDWAEYIKQKFRQFQVDLHKYFPDLANELRDWYLLNAMNFRLRLGLAFMPASLEGFVGKFPEKISSEIKQCGDKEISCDVYDALTSLKDTVIVRYVNRAPWKQAPKDSTEESEWVELFSPI